MIDELKTDGANTHKLLERVPLNQPEWNPHHKSRNIEQLAKHVANLYSWVPLIMTQDQVDFGKGSPFPAMPEMKSAIELTEYFDRKLSAAIEVLGNANDDDMNKPFAMKIGEKTINVLSKAAAIRNIALNHLVHHRAQLGVYLRLLDVPIPGMYGPSADEQSMRT